MTSFADLFRPLALLRLLAADHPDLPAPDVHVSRLYPEQLVLSVHDSFGTFEAWREALGIDPDTIERKLQGSDTKAVLRASATIADASVELVGYGPNVALLAAVAA